MAEQEAVLLRGEGHSVVEYRRSNSEIADTPLASISVAMSLSQSPKTAAELDVVLSREMPDIAHFHNTFPLITPGAYGVCARRGVPVVQTLHNYRLLCPATTLFRNGRECRDCVSKAIPWPAVLHSCYRESRGASAASAVMLARARAAGTFVRDVDLYLAVSRFVRDEHVAAGLPADRILVRENCLGEDPGAGSEDRPSDFLYAGRLSTPKGVHILLESWSRLKKETSLKIVGEGPLAPLAARGGRGVAWLGKLGRREVLSLMRNVRAVVVPSIWPEPCPMVAIEALATGTPVIACSSGGLAGLIEDGITGFLVKPGDSAGLVRAVDRLRDDGVLAREMGRNARRAYEARFSPAVGAQTLLAAYARLLPLRSAR